MKCPYSQKLNNMTLCMLYCHFKIDGKHWANYPDCDKENCLFLHPELLGHLIWEENN